MIKTLRLNIYPTSDEQMKDLIEKESVSELKKAYMQMLDGCVKYPTQREWYAVWNIELNDASNTVVGNLSFMGPGKGGVVEIGYGLNAGFEKHGYMTEAVSAVVEWAAAQDNVKLIEAEIEENNIASKHVLEKTGFILNGTMGKEGPRYVWKH